MSDATYFRIGRLLGGIVGAITFLGSWWYCAANYGFLLGFGLGWLPSGIAAALAFGLVTALWGIVAVLVLAAAGFALLRAMWH